MLKANLDTRRQVLAMLPGNITADVAEDIASDVALAIIEAERPDSLERLVRTFTEKNVNMYVSRGETVSMSVLRTNAEGGNKVTHIIDEEQLSQLEAFEQKRMDEYYLIEID